MENTPQIQAFGLPWFAREDYEAFRRLLPKRAWHATFDQWQAAAQQTFDKLHAQPGVRVFKAHVKSDAFAQWCRASGRHIDTDALLHYGNEFAARQLLETPSH